MILQGQGEKKKLWTRKKAQSDPILLSSGLYRRYRNLTGSCQKARGLYRRWGIAPRPEERYLTEKYTTTRERACQSRRGRVNHGVAASVREGPASSPAISGNSEENDMIYTIKLTKLEICNIIDASS